MQTNAYCKCYHREGCQHTSKSGAHEVLVHVHIKTPLTTMGAQALFVVNSVKLHLTAFKKEVYTIWITTILIG